MEPGALQKQFSLRVDTANDQDLILSGSPDEITLIQKMLDASKAQIDTLISTAQTCLEDIDNIQEKLSATGGTGQVSLTKDEFNAIKNILESMEALGFEDYFPEICEDGTDEERLDAFVERVSEIYGESYPPP